MSTVVEAPAKPHERSRPMCPTPNPRGSRCWRRSCPVCGFGWASKWKRINFVNLAAYNGPVVMVSVTPPGVDQLPWDDHLCFIDKRRGRAKHVHSGKRGCRAQQRKALEWCQLLSWRWSKMRTAAVNYTARKAGKGQLTLLERVWEPQLRGVVHGHLVLGCATEPERQAARVFLAKLAALAPDYSFGFIKPSPVKPRGLTPEAWGELEAVEQAKHVRLELIPPERAAEYLSSYLTGRSKSKPSIRETLVDPGMTWVGAGGSVGPDGKAEAKRVRLSFMWMTPKLTRLTHCTMRNLRRAGHVWACAAGFCEQLPIWQDAAEAVKCVALWWRIYRGRAGPLADEAVSQVLDFARSVDDSRERHYKRYPNGKRRPFYDDENQALLTRWALQWLVAAQGYVEEAAAA